MSSFVNNNSVNKPKRDEKCLPKCDDCNNHTHPSYMTEENTCCDCEEENNEIIREEEFEEENKKSLKVQFDLDSNTVVEFKKEAPPDTIKKIKTMSVPC